MSFLTARRSGFCGCCNCCGGFGCPHVCHHCCGGCCGCCGHGCESITFPVEFGACVDNPCCQCCKKKPKKGYCQWPCMWPCCCECKVPQFKLKPLKPKAVPKDCHTCCHGCCHGCCGCCHCCRKSGGMIWLNHSLAGPKQFIFVETLRKITFCYFAIVQFCNSVVVVFLLNFTLFLRNSSFKNMFICWICWESLILKCDQSDWQIG